MARRQTISFDASRFEAMYGQLTERRRIQALKATYWRLGTMLRAEAVRLLRQGMGSSRELEKGVRLLVFKKKAGFRCTVGTRIKRDKKTKRIIRTWGYHTNRRGLEKPVLIWAEEGTDERYQKERAGGRYTGRMPALEFLARARDNMSGTINDRVRDELMTATARIARRYGCTVS